MIIKVSDITYIDVADFIRLDEVGYADQVQLTAFLDAAKDYVKNYTGLPLSKYSATTDEAPAEGKTYFVKNKGKYIKFNGEAFGADTYYEQISDDDVDDYADMVIAVLILCQDMYDNRTLYVDKGSPNMTVQTILDMHRRCNIC